MLSKYRLFPFIKLLYLPKLSNSVDYKTVHVELLIQDLSTNKIYKYIVKVKPLRSQDAIYEAITQVTGKGEYKIRPTTERSNLVVLGAWINGEGI